MRITQDVYGTACKSWLTFWLILVGTGGPSGRGPPGFGGSIGPFWDRFDEVVPPSFMLAFQMLFLVFLASVAGERRLV